MVGESVGYPRSFSASRCAALLLAILLAPGCAGRDSDPLPLTAEVPLHLEEHLDVATIEGSEVPEDLPEPVEWRFDEPQPGWQPVVTMNPNTEPVKVERTDDALRLTLDESNLNGGGNPRGGIVIDLPQWNGEDWGSILVRARSSEGIQRFTVGFNTSSGAPSTTRGPYPYEFGEGTDVEGTDVVNDGTVQTYLLQAPQGTWNRLGLWVAANKPATFDVLSVSVVSSEEDYADAPAGTRPVSLGLVSRQAIYSHAPGRISYRVVVPEAGRLDVALGVLRGMSATFRIAATRDGGERQVVLEQVYAGEGAWDQHSVDLSSLQGQTVTLSLEADAEHPGTVVLWGAPTMSGTRTTDKPNVVFFVIDGGAAELMSVYGYNRRTTPHLERLATEGALFERAYSNASWTRPSTASFMSSLQNSVMGGARNGFNVVPDEASTMAQHMHRAGYQTAVFTANPNAGSMSGLERGVDVFRESWDEFSYVGRVGRFAESSRITQEAFWQWRGTYPGAPYWVHFQTTDTHRPWLPVSPFAGLFLSPERREAFDDWGRRLQEAGPPGATRFERAGVDPEAHYQVRRSMYDEGMAHTDYQIGRLVERLKAAGEWENTLFIVASDHSHASSGLGWPGPSPPQWGPPAILSSWISRIPMIVVWPGRIAAGQRFNQPVSMIDVLPTILDLIDLPLPEVMQGQSLAPLLLGEEGWEPRPVILDEFSFNEEAGEFRGRIEVIDGRWGASLQINPNPQRPPDRSRPAPLLLYDLWNDPMALWSLHEERPDLVEKYTAFLEEQFEAHLALSQYFTRSGEVELTPEQLRSLRALGYIR